MTSPVLQTESLEIGYGGIAIGNDISLSVSSGEIVGIIGINGCGKSTLLRTIVGELKPLSGSIQFHGAAAQPTTTWQRVRNFQIGYVPQARKNFPSLTVRENLHLALWHSRESWSEKESRIECLFSNICFAPLRDHLHELCSSLSGGEDMILALAKSLLRKTKLLILDEPSAGLSEMYREELVTLLRSIGHSTAVLFVEQSLSTVFNLADTVYMFRTLDDGGGNSSASISSVEKLPDERKLRLQESYRRKEIEEGIAEVAALFA